MSEEDNKSCEASLDIDDDDNDKPNLHLDVQQPVGVSQLVNSPTTDTLDSVILENPITDDAKSEDGLEEEIKLDISEMEDSQKTENTDLSSYFGEMNVKDDAFPDISESTSDQPGVDNSNSERAGNAVDIENDKHAETASTNISSYFSSDPSSSGVDFFDTISSPELETQPQASSEVPVVVAGSNTTMVENNSMVQQTLVSEEQVETVEFEGEAGIQGDLPVAEMQADDDFESFTAENSEVTVGSAPIDTTNIPTPTELSPLTTPVHQPTVDPLNTFISSGVERQTSQTLLTQPPIPTEQPSSTPSSPFHQFQTPSVPSVFDNFGDGNITDDPFTASLCMSDSDRRHDAWIPSDATRHILISMTSSVPGTYMPAIEQLCSPSVLRTDPQGDPVRDLVLKYMGEQEAVKRQVLTADSVSRDENGLSQLVAAGCLRAGVDLTGYLLADVGQGHGQQEAGTITQHSPKTLQLWFCRFALLMRLRLFEILDSEMRAFNSMDSPDLYFEFYPQLYPGRRGSMVSFGLRILHAELPHYLNRHQESLDKLYYVLAVTSKIVKNLENGLSEDGAGIELSAESRKASIKLWQSREIQVQYKIASVLLSMKDYEASISIFEMLMNKECENRIALMSGIGRIYLQMGNVIKATEAFKQVESETCTRGNSFIAMNSINKGFLSMCVNNFSEAYEHFKSAVQLEPSNTCAVNNMAVCSLYMCRLKDALNTLEALVHNNPGQNLHEGVLFNLCTLYELESSRALHKKQAVLDMVNKHKGDGFPVVCLKMS